MFTVSINWQLQIYYSWFPRNGTGFQLSPTHRYRSMHGPPIYMCPFHSLTNAHLLFIEFWFHVDFKVSNSRRQNDTKTLRQRQKCEEKKRWQRSVSIGAVCSPVAFACSMGLHWTRKNEHRWPVLWTFSKLFSTVPMQTYFGNLTRSICDLPMFIRLSTREGMSTQVVRIFHEFSFDFTNWQPDW